MKNISKKLLSLALAATSLTAWADAPRYIFYFIGDGMGVGAAITTDMYWRNALGNDDHLLMMQFPVGGLVTTQSANSTVTDSAAAGTALATGKKTRNSMLGMDADSVAVTSMAKVLHDNGWGVGLVTTVSPDDATPGAFYAHVPSRRMFYEIGRQAVESGYEFIAGAPWRGMKDSDGNPTDLRDYIRAAGDIDYTHDIDRAAASALPRVMLTPRKPFAKNNVGYPIDSIPDAFKIQDMTRAALAHMQRVSPERFFLMIEGGNIDHVAHSNDGGGVAVETLAFNEALQLAYDFYLQHPDETLIVVTADHETGGMSLGNRHVGYTSYSDLIPLQRMSKEMFSKKVKALIKAKETPSWDEFKTLTADATGLWNGIEVTGAQEEQIKDLYEETFVKRAELQDEKTLYASFNALANKIYNILNDNLGIGWTTSGHSGAPVPLYAIGQGTEIFGAWQDNTEIAPKLMKLAGYEF